MNEKNNQREEMIVEKLEEKERYFQAFGIQH